MMHLYKPEYSIKHLFILLVFCISTQCISAQAPVISSFTPAAGGQGTSIQIRGTALSNITAISFGGVPASFFYFNTDTSVFAIVGPGGSGHLSITTTAGKDSIAGFTFLYPASISSISPVAGFSGDLITIYGQNFSATETVRFGDMQAASFTQLTDTSISAVVGNGASGPVTVTNLLGTASGPNFTYLGPNITSFSPISGRTGAKITINGTNLSGATAVHFGGTAAQSFTVLSDSKIEVIVGNGTNGDVTVTSAAGTGTKGTFYIVPTINSFSPLSGPVGTSVTISGSNFSPIASANRVWVGGVKATVTAASSTALTITIPAGLNNSPLSVSVNGYTAYAAQPFTTTFAAGPFIPGFFAMRQNLSVFYSPTGVIMGDLNGDGKPDLAACNSNGLALYKNNSTAANINFANPSNVSINSGGHNTTGLVMADFTGDDKPDLAVINYGNSTMSVFLNQSSANTLSFPYRIDLPTGTYPTAIVSADVDRDGRADILVANNNSNTVSVFINIGNAGLQFAPRQDYYTGVNPNAMAVADFDNDGWQDIAVTNENAATVTILKNTGSTGANGFSFLMTMATGTYPRGLAASDFDADGYCDLVVTGLTPMAVSVFKNSSTGTGISFNPKTDYPTTGFTNNVAVNDMDGDGKPDMLAGFDVFKNTGSAGSISFANSPLFPDHLANLVTGDVDGDGKPDIVSVDMYGIGIYRNKVNLLPEIASISPLSIYPGDTVTITGNNFTGATAVSFGGIAFNSFALVSDKIIKAIPGPGTGGDVSVTTPYGTATAPGFAYFLAPVITGISPQSGPIGSTVTITGNHFGADAASNKVKFGTLNAQVTAASSGSLSVVVPAGAGNERISVNNNGRMGSSPMPFAVTFPGAGSHFDQTYFDTSIRLSLGAVMPGYLLASGDMEEDGKPDLVVSSNIVYMSDLSTFKNTGSPGNISFGPKTIQPLTQNISSQPLLLDVNGDGKQEVLICNGGIPALRFFKNQSNNGNIYVSFDSSITYNSLGIVTAHAGDFDGDGRADLIIKSFYNPAISVFRNSSASGVLSYAAPLVIGSGSGTITSGGSILIEDFDMDGRPDIGHVYDYKISIFKNTGALGEIKFAPPVHFSSLLFAREALAADLDGDGRTDIIKLNISTNEVGVIRNNSSGGNISFETEINFPMNFNLYQILVADLDGDAKPEICANSNNTNIIAILKNNSVPGTLAFAPPKEYLGNGPGKIQIADLDTDGKPDIISASQQTNMLGVLRNTIAEPIRLLLCPPAANVTISSNISGAVYQWQVDMGAGYVNISDDAHYSNSNSATLQITGAESSWTGYRYRCLADGISSYVSALSFGSRWTGTINSDWNNPGNWSCASIPDANTDVIISAGNVLINTNVTVRSLFIQQGATVTVNTGFTLTVLH